MVWQTCIHTTVFTRWMNSNQTLHNGNKILRTLNKTNYVGDIEESVYFSFIVCCECGFLCELLKYALRVNGEGAKFL